MEILSENVSHIERYIAIIGGGLLVGIGILFLVTLVSAIIEDASDFFAYGLILVALGMVSLGSAGVYEGFTSEPEITHEVIIDDYNEVYENGYEITEKKGERLYVVRKTEEGAE